MELNNNGMIISSLENKLEDKISRLNKFLGTEISFNPESVLSNIVLALSVMQQNLENQIAYLVKQYDINTAENIYLDSLFERVALSRYSSNPTTFSIKVSGVPNCVIQKGELILTEKATGQIFYNSSAFQFNNSGFAFANMQSYIEDNIPVNTGAIFSISNKPSGVETVFPDTVSDVVVGNPSESDKDFRERFKNNGNNNEKCTRNSVLMNLSKYTGGLDFVSIADVNSNQAVPPGAIKVIAKNIVSDEEFAEAILDNTMAGISYIGNTSVEVTKCNQTFVVRFTKAKSISIDINVVILLKSGFYRNSVIEEVKDSIMKYLSKKTFGLKSSVYASNFLISVLQTAGVAAVSDIKIKKTSSHVYESAINLAADEVPVFSASKIYVICDEE
ncbi:MAG: baseplate J/gp47 family protein [Candidatus Gastranaerophilaceae bacterium]|nr:baseplate J/gp47 family protein [Candidatus Gastranaerophilaceae bacterium]